MRAIIPSLPSLDVMKPIRIRSGAEETRWFVRFLAGLSVLAIGGAVIEHLTPSAPPFRGRLAWIIEAIFTLTGSPGLIVLWLLLAVALAVAASFIWRHTARYPPTGGFGENNAAQPGNREGRRKSGFSQSNPPRAALLIFTLGITRK